MGALVNTAAATRLTGRMQGLWRDIPDAKLAAYIDWLERLPASEKEVGAALDSLAETSEFVPSIKKLREALQAQGALGAPQQGVSDKRMVALHVASLTHDGEGSVRDVCRLLGRDYGERLTDERATHAAYLLEAEANDMGESAAWYRDRIEAYDQLIREHRGLATAGRTG